MDVDVVGAAGAAGAAGVVGDSHSVISIATH